MKFLESAKITQQIHYQTLYIFVKISKISHKLVLYIIPFGLRYVKPCIRMLPTKNPRLGIVTLIIYKNLALLGKVFKSLLEID